MRTFHIAFIVFISFAAAYSMGCGGEDDNCGSTSGCEPPPETCGDGLCRAQDGESTGTCPEDCPVPTDCGDAFCDPSMGENPMSCADDCAVDDVCGNTVCDLDAGENVFSCVVDCPAFTCGNGNCDGNESNASCPADCR